MARICLCVLMNHPFPANIALLRRIYKGRFTHIRYLIPFERMPDEDVITVYRGSYTHAAYLTDAQKELSALDCDYFIVVQDDVLLNPALSEVNFADVFGLAPDDGFIPRIGPVHTGMHEWPWLAGFVPKLLYPKSILFGGGVESANLNKFLPDAAVLEQRIASQGHSGTNFMRIDPDPVDSRSMPEASRLLLHGLSTDLDQDKPEQRRIDQHSLDAARSLLAAMREDQALAGHLTGEEGAPTTVRLPFPLAMSGYVTDFYIIPQSGFDDFCHYIGVAAAANLFVEIMAPTLLYACCLQVKTAEDCRLDFSGFDASRHLDYFTNPHAMAIHPFKLSLFRSEDDRAGLLDALHEVGEGRRLSGESPLAHATFGRWPGGFLGSAAGWHGGEDWGVWSAEKEVAIPITLPATSDLRVSLQGPVAGIQSLSGSLRTGGGRIAELLVTGEQPRLDVLLKHVQPAADGIARLMLRSDSLIRPSDVYPDSNDTRQLGFGLIRIERVST